MYAEPVTKCHKTRLACHWFTSLQYRNSVEHSPHIRLYTHAGYYIYRALSNH